METEQERMRRLWTWYKVFDSSKHNPKFRGFPEVNVTAELLDNIFAQLQSMVGQRNILFLAGDRDRDLWRSYFTGGSYSQDYNEHIVGTLTAVDRNPVGYIDPADEIYVQIEVDDKFKSLPLKAYELHVGLDFQFTKFKPYEEPITYKEKFEIESCKVKGLYFKEFDNFNHIHGASMSNYYGLRALGMYIYIPGRCYW